MDELKLELEELNNFKGMVHSDTFQKFILEPMLAEQNDLKSAYDCDSLKQLYTVKGRKQGLEKFFSLIANIDTKIENKHQDIKQLESSDGA